jgi:hypothetical protein
MVPRVLICAEKGLEPDAIDRLIDLTKERDDQEIGDMMRKIALR